MIPSENPNQTLSQIIRVFPENGHTTADHIASNTAFAGFAEQIAELAGQSENLLFFMCALEHSQNALKDLDIRGFIEKVK